MTAVDPAPPDAAEVVTAQTAPQPFLRWPGGKRWLLDEVPHLFRGGARRVLDPFLGGGAFIFCLPYTGALAGDINPELIATYKAVRASPEEVWDLLSAHARKHSSKHYLAQRTVRPDSATEAAARFIYLNQTSFNGLHRVNRSGDFNVPMGDRTVRTTLAELLAASSRLTLVDLRCADFEAICREARSGDLLVLDPPYTVKHDHNGFVRYNESIFTWSDQERLATEAALARRRGANVIVTNANHKSVHELYPEQDFTRISANRSSRLSAKPSGRSECTEAIFIGKPLAGGN